MNKLKIAMLSLILLALAAPFVGACTSASGAWINCTMTLNQTDPFSGILQTIHTNSPWFFWVFYAVIYISVIIMTRIANPEGVQSFAYGSYVGLCVAIVLYWFGYVGSPMVDIAISLVGVTVLAMWLFR